MPEQTAPIAATEAEWTTRLSHLADTAIEASDLALAALRRANEAQNDAPPEAHEKAELRLERALRTQARLVSLAQRTLTLLARLRGWLQPARRPAEKTSAAENRIAALENLVAKLEQTPAPPAKPFNYNNLNSRQRRALRARQHQTA